MYVGLLQGKSENTKLQQVIEFVGKKKKNISTKLCFYLSCFRTVKQCTEIEPKYKQNTTKKDENQSHKMIYA